MSIDTIIDGIIGREGVYSNNPNDLGGETMWGITASEARRSGYGGPMQHMPRETAILIYRRKYITQPRFDTILALSGPVGEELIDTGVNMGQVVAAKFLQRALNVFNNQGTYYGDIVVDGEVGPGTRAALSAFLARRGAEGEKVLVSAMNALQGVRYIELCEARQKNETFVFGWFNNRVCV